MRAAAAVVFLIGMAAFGVLAWASRKAMTLGRAADIGDLVILGVFAIFGLFCVGVAWHLFRTPPDAHSPAAEPPRSAASPPKRVTMSHGCSTAGVLLLMLSALLPAHFYPVVLLFLGLVLLAVAHVLTPCEERLEKLRKARASLTQL